MVEKGKLDLFCKIQKLLHPLQQHGKADTAIPFYVM